MAFNDIVKEIDHLSPEERRKLMDILLDSFMNGDEEKPKSHDITEFKGIGARLRTQDAQDYVNQLRDEWDHRSS